MSRTENSMRNLRYAALLNLALVIVNFVARRIFVTVLSEQYLGLNGTFTNILSMLSIAELGVGTAITYSMYKPLAVRDEDLLLSLMALYRRFYRIIGLVIAVLGVALTPLLPYFTHDLPDIENIRLIYLLFVLDSALSYALVYKQSLISADQKQYIVTAYRNIALMVLAVVQSVLLLLTKNYYVYLAAKIVSTVAINVLLARKADRMYPFLRRKDIPELPGSVRHEISKNIRATLIHKLGTVVVFQTDNLLIALFVGAVSVGIYSNYVMITAGLTTAYLLIFRSITASVGNLCAEDDKTHAREVFWQVDLFGRWLYGFSAICLVALLNHFIGSVWLTEDYLFPMKLVLIIAANFYITGMRHSVLTYRDAMGLYWYDRYKAIFEAIINLVVSILLARRLGILGIFIGTFVSTVTTCLWVEPYMLFKHGFQFPVRGYFARYAVHTLLTLAAGVLTWYVCALLSGTGLMPFVGKLCICAVLPNLVFWLFYRRTPEYCALKRMILRRLKRA